MISLGSVVTILVLVALFAGVIRYMYVQKKNGSGSCGCGSGCSGCAHKKEPIDKCSGTHL